MKKTRLFIYLSVSVILFSCGPSEYEDSMDNTKDCIEEKLDDEIVKYKTIDEALTAYEFESARVLLSCYEDACFQSKKYRVECLKESYQSDKEWREQKIAQNDHYKMLNAIVQAEVTYFLNSGEYSRALASANESDMFFVYKDKLPSAINKWVDEKKYDLVLRVLSQYTFETQFEKAKPTSQKYNDEITEFNDMLSSLSNAALLNGNAEVLKKCLLIIKPIAVEDTNSPKNYYGDSKYTLLSDKPKQDLILKISEAGIKL